MIFDTPDQTKKRKVNDVLDGKLIKECFLQKSQTILSSTNAEAKLIKSSKMDIRI